MSVYMCMKHSTKRSRRKMNERCCVGSNADFSFSMKSEAVCVKQSRMSNCLAEGSSVGLSNVHRVDIPPFHMSMVSSRKPSPLYISTTTTSSLIRSFLSLSYFDDAHLSKRRARNFRLPPRTRTV